MCHDVLESIGISSSSNSEKTLDMLKIVGIDKVMVEDLPEPTSCRSAKMKCNPALGGLAMVIPDETDSRGYSGSIGYKATDNNDVMGFVTAGHVADWSTRDSTASSNTVINYYGNKDKLGTVTEAYGIASPSRSDGKTHVDAAFVQSNYISDDVMRGPNLKMDAVSYASLKSDHTEGDFIYRMGAASGKEDLGTIKSVFSNTNVIRMTGMSASEGDSGGPIYQKVTRDTVNILGHTKSKIHYIPVSAMIDLYGITPMLR